MEYISVEKVDVTVYFETTYVAGGNKKRKNAYFFSEAEKNGHNAVVTAGAANSNHAKVVALACAERGWKCIIVVHDKEDYSKGNLLLMKLAGAKLVFTTLGDVGPVMDQEMSRLRDEGCNPYYIYGGGHGLPGYLAYFDAAKDFIKATPAAPPPITWCMRRAQAAPKRD